MQGSDESFQQTSQPCEQKQAGENVQTEEATSLTSNDKDSSLASSHPPQQAKVSAPSRFAFLSPFLSNVLLPFLMMRASLVVVGMVSIYYILPLFNRKQPILPDRRITHFPDMLYLMWVHFDSGFYLSIAHDGYWGANTLHSGSNWGFFPLYPMLIHCFATPFGPGIDAYIIVGLVLANGAAVVAALYLYKLTTYEFNSSVGVRAAFFMGLFPLSFYLSAVYPESLFLACAISSVYYARLRRWWLAGLLGGLAALARSSGVLLGLGLAWEYWQYLGDRYSPMEQTEGFEASLRTWLRSRLSGLVRSLASLRTWAGFTALALVPVALALFLGYSRWKVGAFDAYFIAQQYGWNHYASNPIQLILHFLHHPDTTNPYNWDFYSLNIIATLLFGTLLIPIFRKLPTIYGIIALAFLVIPLTTGKLDSIARYDLTIFPVYMLLAWWSNQGPLEQQIRRYGALTASFAILQGVGMVLFTLGVYSIA